MPEELLSEKDLENDIEEYLITHGGYKKGDPKKFNKQLALDTETLLNFIKTTQSRTWEKYIKIYGDKSEQKFIERFDKEVNRTGLINILRYGISDRGQRFKIAYWKPETTINKESAELYEKNILHCTRQLHYSPSSENSIDIVLFLNGIPIISIELKNQFTGQNVQNAISQYKLDRSGRNYLIQHSAGSGKSNTIAWLLKSDLFSRDKIWFTEKGEDLASKLYSLVEFKREDRKTIRKDENYEKNYMMVKSARKVRCKIC